MKNVKELLLQVRKGATASFTPANWVEALRELGEMAEIQMEGRQQIRFVIRRGGGKVGYVADKDPSHIRLNIYGVFIEDYFKSRGKDLRKMASEHLGMETVEQERIAKGKAARDLDHTGTCPVCDRNIKLETDNNPKKGTMVHHGYRRPGRGSIVGDCFGVGFQPLEVSPFGTAMWIGEVERWLKATREQIFHLECKLDQLELRIKSAADNDAKLDLYNQHLYNQHRDIKFALVQTEFEAERTKRDLEEAINKTSNWAPKPLPENQP